MVNKDLKDYKIGVFRGGVSPEREISLVSGQHVVDALKTRGYKVVDVDLNTEKEKQIIQIVKDNGIDLVFIALHGGFGEDGGIQRVFERNRILFTGSSSESSYLAMDKIETRRILKNNDIPCPQSWIVDEDVPGFSQEDLPLIVKPHYAGSSVGVSILNDLSLLKEAVDKARRISSRVLVEQYIKGRELTVGIVGRKVFPVIEIVFKKDFFDFTAKYKDHQTQFVAPANIDKYLSDDIQGLAFKVYQALGCKGVGRVDLILDNKNNPFILEINSIPGLTPHSLLPLGASQIGWGFADLCERVLELAVSEKAVKKGFL